MYVNVALTVFECLLQAIIEDEDERPTEGLAGAMSNMAVTNNVKESIVNKNKTVLTDMGFQRSDIEEAVTDLINQGTRVTYNMLT